MHDSQCRGPPFACSWPSIRRTATAAAEQDGEILTQSYAAYCHSSDKPCSNRCRAQTTADRRATYTPLRGMTAACPGWVWGDLISYLGEYLKMATSAVTCSLQGAPWPRQLCPCSRPAIALHETHFPATLLLM